MSDMVTAARLRDVFGSLTHDSRDLLPLIERFYHPDVRLQDPVQIQVGRDRVMEAYERMLDRAVELHIDMIDAAESERAIYLTWSMYMRFKRGIAFSIDGVSHFQLRNGLIVEQRDYWDLLGAVVNAFPRAGLLYRKLVAKLV